MSRRKFSPKDWALIKYGEFAGSYARVTMLDKEGGYVVIPYDSNNEPRDVMTLNARAMDRIEPYVLTIDELKKLVSARIMYRDIKDRVFPPFNIKAESDYVLRASDIRDALLYIGGRGSVLEDFKEWFWIIINVFYDDLHIKERYKEDFFSDCPENDDEMFSVAYSLVEKLYWRLEERYSQKEFIDKFIIKFAEPFDWEQGTKKKPIEESGYKAVSDDIISRVNVYEYNQTRPRDRWIYSSSEKKHIVSEYDNKGSLKGVDPEGIEQFREFVEDLYNEGEALAIKLLAWGYFEGNEAFPKDMTLAKQYLEELFAKTGDPYAANALGYIYYYGFANNNVPEYQNAFRYFSFGALAGIDEGSYRAADMLLEGKGTVRNQDMALNIIVDGYRDNMNDFCSGNYENKLPEYAYRMGNACRKDLIYGMGMRDAYKFYLEAKLAIRMRRNLGKHPGDSTIENKIDYEIQQIVDRFRLDKNAVTLRTDFPLYITQLFEDRYPLKVQLEVPRGSRTGTLKISRFRFGKEMFEKSMPPGTDSGKLFEVPKIMVAYPELSYAELVSEMTYTIEGVAVAQKHQEGKFFVADGFKKNETTNALEFYSNNNLVAAVDAQWYVITVDKSQKES